MELEANIKAEYETLVRFASVGADSAHLSDCRACAAWLKRWLEELGFEVALKGRPERPPYLVAQRAGDAGLPRVLHYGHYDVQPPDPLEAWVAPPFEPTWRGERLYARGAQDDKGQFFSFLCGVRDYLREPGPHVPLTILLEGEEESGSGVLTAEAPILADLLKADILTVCDTSAAKNLQPAVVAGLRGVAHFTLRLAGANRDLHSGEYGGIAPNAAQAMCELLSSLHDARGAIAVPGFEAGLELPSEEERSIAEASAMTSAEFEADTGVPPVGGEAGLSLTERNCFRATIEVNGVHSGYGGPGSKTVIPCEAVAKLSMRYAPGMNPQAAMTAVTRHLNAHCPRGMKLFLEDVTGEVSGFRIPIDSPLMKVACDVLGTLDARGAVIQWDGASIPVVSTLLAVSGAAPLMVGFGQSEDAIHSPNESFSVRQFCLARMWARKILERLSSRGL